MATPCFPNHARDTRVHEADNGLVSLSLIYVLRDGAYDQAAMKTVKLEDNTCINKSKHR